MRAVLAALIVAWLTTPALAQQQQHMQEYGQPDKDKTAAEKAADKAAAAAYQRSINAIPDKGSTDPWGNVRSNDAPKPAPTKTAKSKAKSGNAEAKPQ